MTSVPQRHTYYGAPTSSYTQSRQSASYSSQKRKHVTFGPYIVGSTLGEGEFGKVKMGWSKTSSSSKDVPKQVAIKLIRRDTIPKNSEKEVKIYREINALKHLNHPNIVRLEEVLQNSKYIGIVLEYASGGEFYKYIQKKRRLKESAACRLFAQLISGVYYMHSKGLVHRDLKLENLLLDKNENLLITDFGFVNEFLPENELMKTSCGSPCYAAPELVVTARPYEARKADIWSCGVIMYAMLAGYLPWDDDPENPDGDDIGKLYRYITRTPLKFPDYIAPVPRDLLRAILVADPKKRITIAQTLHHQWLQPHLPFLSVMPEEWDHVSKNQEFLRQPPQKGEAVNSARPRSNCSVSSTNSKGEKRNSLIMDSSLYSQPVPPQQSQSHAVAMPSSPSPRLRQSPVKSNNRHSRSNSAASIALQAVVDAEREYHATHPPFTSSASTSALQFEVSPHSTSPRLYTFSPTKANQNTVTSLRDSVIIETSPQKGSGAFLIASSLKESPNGTGLPEASSVPTTSGFKAPLAVKAQVPHHGTHNLALHRRPRPTSYHPASCSTFGDTSQAPTSQPAVSGEATTGQTQANIGKRTSQGIMHRDSFSMNKPFVDMQIVAGDLIKSGDDGDTVAKKIHDQVEDADHRVDLSRQRRQSQRYSVVYDKLFGVAQQSEDNAVEDAGPGGSTVERGASGTSVKRDKKRFSIMSIYSPSRSSVDSGSPKNEDKHKGTGSENNPSGSSKRTPSRQESLVNDQADTSRKSSAAKKTEPTKQASTLKEVKADASRKTSNPISKQESLGQSSVHRDSKAEARAEPEANKKNPTVQRSASLKKAAKPPQTRKKVNRSSVMVSSVAAGSTENARPREQSTAKRVIDFFKRRSMRL
ncbi:Protein kinase domain-containing protein [Lachancea thermotolerans]